MQEAHTQPRAQAVDTSCSPAARVVLQQAPGCSWSTPSLATRLGGWLQEWGL